MQPQRSRRGREAERRGEVRRGFGDWIDTIEKFIVDHPSPQMRLQLKSRMIPEAWAVMWVRNKSPRVAFDEAIEAIEAALKNELEEKNKEQNNDSQKEGRPQTDTEALATTEGTVGGASGEGGG